MKHSESIAKLAPALVKANAAVQHATKDSSNPHFKSRFASLNSVVDTVKPAYAAQGLTVVQMPGFSDGHATLETIVLHESGEWMSGVSGSPLQKNDPQGIGSAITYLRRYSMSAAAGIAQEDDDGNAASSAPAPSRQATSAPPRRPAAAPDQSVAPAITYLDDMTECPKCGGPMWDNRKGKTNPKSPDLKCKDKAGCDEAIWLSSWRDDLIREISVAYSAGSIDVTKRTLMEDAVNSLSPASLAYTRKRLQELNQ
jgi:hypothetical protein